jgi:uncharacterized protein (DUF2267 family)
MSSFDDAQRHQLQEAFRDGGRAVLHYLRRKLEQEPDKSLSDALPGQLFELLVIDTAGDLWRQHQAQQERGDDE